MSALKLMGVDLQTRANKKSHHTDSYISKDLILRRGQSFKVNLNFNRRLRKGERITFTALTGPHPEESTKTKAVFPISHSSNTKFWRATADDSKQSSNSLGITLSSPTNAIIGQYRLSFQIYSLDMISSHKLCNLILIFNPWVSGDEVYMKDHDERQEYVLNDSGIIYVGNHESYRGITWDYGQFEEHILKICLAIMDRNLKYNENQVKDYARRNDPVYVGRVCSAMVNSNDENGVLAGRWKEPYTNGVKPATWNGSTAILLKWYREQFQPVKYGQCWVFAGVLCTVLRCLGIPARIISNFESAHDTDVNLSIDEYYNTRGEKQSSNDSVWNFHVWNEAWFTRRDLGSAYDGWQVLDATPQERSEGMYQCGPTSVKAIKEGDINLSYDAPFVFAEVNADSKTWVVSNDGKKMVLFNNRSLIGKFISTKAVLSNSRMDVTQNYKYPEGSEMERKVFQKALHKLFKDEKFTPDISLIELSDELSGESSDDSLEHEQRPQITGKFQLEESPLIGQDIKLNMRINNLSSESNTVQVKICACSIMYTRAIGQTVLKNSTQFHLSSKEEKQVPLKISYSQYENFLTEDNMIQISAVCEDDHGRKLLLQKDIVLRAPTIPIKVPEKVVIKQTFIAEVTFENPLSEVMKNCLLLVEGSGLLKEQLKIQIEEIKPLEKIKIPVEITPFTLGTRQLLADLVCVRFSNVKGFQSVIVTQTL